MKRLSVPEMHCEGCVDRISTALSDAGLEFEIDLPAKQVAVKNDDTIISRTIAILEDLGFDSKDAY